MSTLMLYYQGYKIFWDLGGSTLEKIGYAKEENEVLQSILFSTYLSVFGTITGKAWVGFWCRITSMTDLFSHWHPWIRPVKRNHKRWELMKEKRWF